MMYLRTIVIKHGVPSEIKNWFTWPSVIFTKLSKLWFENHLEITQEGGLNDRKKVFDLFFGLKFKNLNINWIKLIIIKFTYAIYMYIPITNLTKYLGVLFYMRLTRAKYTKYKRKQSNTRLHYIHSLLISS